MSANLNELNGVVSFVANIGKERKDIPWHNLGTYFDRPLSTKEILEMPNFQYKVNKGSLLHISDEIVEAIMRGEPINHLFNQNDIVEGVKCTYRDDNKDILGVVSDSYQVVQNYEGFDFIDKITGADGSNPLAKGAVIETAGILGKGERMFITAKIPSNIRIGDSKEEITDYILFTNGHDGYNAVTALFTPIRVVCNNTLNAALRSASNKKYFRHTTNVHSKLAMAESVMGLHKYYVQEFSETMTALSKKKVNDILVKNLVAEVFLNPEENNLYKANNFSLQGIDEISTRKKNNITNVLGYIYDGVGQENHRGTAYWVYNGFTSYYSNKKNYKEDANKRFEAIMAGDAYNKTQEAFDKLLALQ